MKLIPISAGYIATVDDSDFDALSRYSWTAQINRNRNDEISIVYAQRGVRNHSKTTKIYMHHQVFGQKVRLDHRDHNGLNNCRSNLRVASGSGNLGNSRIRTDNTSGYKGVTWYGNYGKWMAQITHNGKRRCLGYFLAKEDAAAAYRQASLELFGEFAFVGEEGTAI